MPENRATELASNRKETNEPGSKLGAQVRSLRLPGRAESTLSPGSRLAWVLCVILAITSGGLAYQLYLRDGWFAVGSPTSGSANPSNGHDPDGRASPSTTGEKTSTVDAKPAGSPFRSAENATVSLVSRGYVIPAHQVLISPEVSGRIIALHFEEGMVVEKGFVLAEIDATDYENERERALATLELAKQRLLELENGFRPEEIAQASAELEEAEAQRIQLEAQWRRSSELRKTKTLTEQEFELAESTYNAMLRRVERLRLALKLIEKGPRDERILAAKAEVQQADAELAKANLKLAKCQIVAPIAGTILKKNAEQGNIVNPVAFNGSYSICDMADLSDLEVELDIVERDVGKVFKGQQCEIRAEAFRDRVYQGFVSRLMPIADRAKGAVPVRVKLKVPAEEQGVYLKPQMSADVTFLAPTPAPPATTTSSR